MRQWFIINSFNYEAQFRYMLVANVTPSHYALFSPLRSNIGTPLAVAVSDFLKRQDENVHFKLINKLGKC